MLKLFLILSVAVLICGCERHHTSNAASPKSLPSFANEMFTEITPMADGSAYAADCDSRIWFLHGNKAVQVTVGSKSQQKLPLLSDITPLLDGGAYAISLDTGGLWYLRAEHAESVTEVPSIVGAGASLKMPEKNFFALYLTERKKRKDAEARAEGDTTMVDYSDR